MKKALMIMCFATLLMVVAAPAQADPIVSWSGDFTSDHCTGSCGSSPFGTVLLTQDGSDVDFTVTLINGNRFMRSGAGDGMNFKFNATGIVLADISVPTSLTKATGNFGGDGGGMFNYGVYFTGQTNGGGQSLPGPIMFTVLNATIPDFISLNNAGHIFVADIIGGDINGNTGLVGVTGGTENFTPVPEPSTLLLLGMGLAGIGFVSRKRI
jgi:hypothetical protein